MNAIRIAALLTCHNRREKTIACLRALRSQLLPGWNSPLGVQADKRCQIQEDSSPVHDLPPPSRFVIEVFLVDDGSTDGTAAAVQKYWPEVKIIRGSGNLYWCGGMRVAWAEALVTDPDYYLLLNDDTILFPNALISLLEMTGPPCEKKIATAAIRDPQSGKVVYGGIWLGRPRQEPAGQNILCDTLNTNAALVPRAVFQEIGGFYHAYTHAMGDMDYGLMAKRAGIPTYQSANVLGECENNPYTGTWRDTSLSISARIQKMNSPKGLPWREWVIYCRRNTGVLWPRYVLSPYLRILAKR